MYKTNVHTLGTYKMNFIMNIAYERSSTFFFNIQMFIVNVHKQYYIM